ncbi:agmatine deiminase family protein [Flavobacterium sp. DGU11]|uniref:Agmatine deiminase family protein n=1 Tax=Flavobacterium arundinis TaxID=3139143 RepID=A0ABU9HZE2_9FLAO
MRKLYSFLFLLSLTIASPPLSAQEIPLPNGFTQAERNLVSGFSFRNAMMTPPPPSAVRTAAEWEEVEYLVVTWDPWYPNILRQIVQAGVAECKVIITTEDEASVSEYLTSNGISLTNIIFMNAPWDSIWTRDYSANTVYANDVGERALLDWIYNRPRPNDNVMPSAHAALTGIPIYVTDSGLNDLVNTGGNWMSDGLGNAFASELILDENNEGNPYGVSVKSEEQIDGIMESYMGITNYIKMPTLPYDGIHHIDMHMKLLNEETLLVSRYPEGVADGPQIEANINYVLANYLSPFGTPYEVRWVDAPPSTSGNYPDTDGYYRTYSNATIVNKTVLIPLYRPETDAAAIALYQELMPGYTIVGIDVDDPDETLIASSGAIHCITHTIGVDEPLLIVHQAVKEAAAGTMVNIHAMIKHASGISNAKVFWRNAGTVAWNETAMALAEGDWAANIPVNEEGDDVEYYIWAHANSGKSLTRPMVAPTGFWTINSEVLSVEEWAVKGISAAYPNPAKDAVNFDLNQIDGPVTITIKNLLGQQLYNNTIPNGNGTITLSLADNWNGTLFVTFEGRFGKVVRKVLKT